MKLIRFSLKEIAPTLMMAKKINGTSLVKSTGLHLIVGTTMSVISKHWICVAFAEAAPTKRVNIFVKHLENLATGI